MENMKIELPVVALRGLTVLPEMIIHFDLSREQSKAAVEYAMQEGQQIFLVAQRNPQVEKPDQNALYEIGTIARVKQITRLPNQLNRVLVEGISKGRFVELQTNKEFLWGTLEQIKEEPLAIDEYEEEALLRSLKDVFDTYV